MLTGAFYARLCSIGGLYKVSYFGRTDCIELPFRLPWPDYQVRLALCGSFRDYVVAPRRRCVPSNNEFAAWRADIDDDSHGIVRRIDSVDHIPSFTQDSAPIMLQLC